jgi:hypothetical protein
VRVHATLERLKNKGTLRYKADHKAFFFEVTEKMRALDDHALTKLVLDTHSRLKQVELCNVKKLHCLWNAMSDALITPHNMDGVIKQHLSNYFATGTVNTDSDYAQSSVVEASSDAYLRGDIVTLLNSARESLNTGRQVSS